MRWLTFLAIALIAPSLVAQDKGAGEHGKISCEEIISPKGGITVNHDGLSKEYADQVLKDAIEARDVLHKLGVPTPPHQINIAPERQLNVLTATGILPMPHAISGAEIYQALSTGKTMGVLEFAQPGGAPAAKSGCSTCRSYYANTTSLRDQRPIYLHVGGHNHVFTRSWLAQTRNVDPIAASSELADEMEKLYQKQGFEEVSLFYQYLHAMNQLQDYSEGTFDNPDKLAPEASRAATVTAPQTTAGNWSFLQKGETIKQAPWQKTASVLQFMASNVPSHVPQFKHDLLKKYELTVRTYPTVVQQKFVHEGWATFLMMLGQKHSEKWNSDRDVFDFARVVSGAAGGPLNIQQPYSFGLNGMHHLYLKFKRRPELKGLSELDADIRFVKYIDQLLPTLTDANWIALVVDEEFVNRHHLALVRAGTQEELSKLHEAMAAQGVPQNQWPNAVIISKSAERIKRAIIRRVGIKATPTMDVINPAVSNPFQINLQQRMMEGAPLEPLSAAQVFFAQTQVMEMPVSATFTLAEHWINPQSTATIQARMEVRPDGRARIFNEKNEELSELSKQLEEAIDYYRTDQSFTVSDKVLQEDAKRWEQMFPKMMDEEVAKANVQKLTGISDYAPNAARAVVLFSQLIKSRFAKQMEAAFRGKMKLKFGPNGVKLPLIPMTPHLQFDQQYLQATNSKIPPAPMDTISNRVANWSNRPIDIDDNSGLGPVPGASVGDGIRIPMKGQGGQKSSGGQEPGDDETEPNEVTVPAELYRQMLKHHFDIPNPRQTEGEMPLPREIKMGERRDSSEEPLWEKMAADALVKAVVARRAKGEANVLGKIPYSQLIREGFAKLDEDDYIIRSKREIPLPSFDAVVVMNIDLSGSMAGRRLELVRNFVYNIRELFRAVYPNAKFHYVGLDSRAKEYPEKDIWNVNLGGATEYTPALLETKKILSKYPLAQWNHYVFFAGDSELGDLEKFMQQFNEMRKTLQFFGLIVTRDPHDADGIDTNGLRAALDASKAEWKWVGHSQISDESQIFQGLTDLFGKKQKQ